MSLLLSTSFHAINKDRTVIREEQVRAAIADWVGQSRQLEEDSLSALMSECSGSIAPDDDSMLTWGSGVAHGPDFHCHFRHSHPDRPLEFYVDIGMKLGIDGDRCELGVRFGIEATRGGIIDGEIERTRPKILNQLVRNFDCTIDGQRVTAGWWAVQHQTEVSTVVDYLANTHRNVPVVIAGPHWPQIDHEDHFLRARNIIGGQVAGLALKVGPRNLAAFDYLQQQLQPQLRVPDPGSAIVVWPVRPRTAVSDLGEAVEALDTNGKAPLVLGRQILTRVSDYSRYADPARDFSESRIQELETRSRLSQLQAERDSDTSDSDLDAAFALAEEESQNREKLEVENEQLRTEIFQLKHKMIAIQTRSSSPWPPLRKLRATTTKEAIEVIREYPQLSDRVLVLEKAFDSAIAAQYYEPEALLDAIDLLATKYYDAEIARTQQIHFQTAAQNLGFEYAQTESESTRNNQRMMGERTVRVGGADITLLRHLKRGAAREPKNCLRVYFESVELEGRRVFVVGHMGGHLTTATTGK